MNLQETTKLLLSEDITTVLDTISKLRSFGNVEILPSMLELLKNSRDEAVRASIVNFLNDIKDPRAIPILIKAIEHPNFKHDLPEIVGACWQNGLNFSSHLKVFAKVMVTANYLTAIEASTVIESNFTDLKSSEIDEIISIIQSGINGQTKDKQALMNQLIIVLNTLN